MKKLALVASIGKGGSNWFNSCRDKYRDKKKVFLPWSYYRPLSKSKELILKSQLGESERSFQLYLHYPKSKGHNGKVEYVCRAIQLHHSESSSTTPNVEFTSTYDLHRLYQTWILVDLIEELTPFKELSDFCSYDKDKPINYNVLRHGFAYVVD